MRKLLISLGVTLILLGLVSGGYAWWQVYGQRSGIEAGQAKLNNQLDQEWLAAPLKQTAAPVAPPSSPPTPATPPLEKPAERLTFPKLHESWVVVEGTTQEDLKHAPGHYVGTQQPGEIGNFAVAAHRFPGLFWDLDQLAPGDTVLVETKMATFIYKVTGSKTVHPTDVGVIAANPDNPAAAPTKRLMTLTTCTPKVLDYDRLIVWAVLVASSAK